MRRLYIMEQQKQTTFLGWLREKIQSFFAGVSMLVAKVLLGKNLFEEEYHNLSMKEKAKDIFDEKEKKKEDGEKTKEEKGKEATEKVAAQEKKICDPKELINAQLSFQELVQAQDPQLLNDLTEYMKSNGLNITKSEYGSDGMGPYMQFHIMDKEGETHEFLISDTGNAKDPGISKFIESYCVDHGISLFQTKEKQFESLIQTIQKTRFDHDEHQLNYWNHAFRFTSEDGKTRVMMDDREIFSGRLDLDRFFAGENGFILESTEYLIEFNRHVLTNMLNAMYHAELESLGYDLEEEKEQIQLEEVVKMETSFQDKMKANDLDFLNTLREGLCKETGLSITTSYVLPPKSLDMHGKESLLQINIGEGPEEKHIMIDELGCVVKNEMPNEEVLNALQQVCIQNEIGLLPDMKEFSDCLFEEAKYDVVLGNEHSSLNFLGNEINIQYENRQNEISIHCNGSQLFRGDLENLLDQNIVKDIYAGVYEQSLSYLGYEVLEEEHVDPIIDPVSFSEQEMEMAQEDFLLEQQRAYEEEQMQVPEIDHSECCGSDDHDFVWDEEERY